MLGVVQAMSLLLGWGMGWGMLSVMLQVMSMLQVLEVMLWFTVSLVMPMVRVV